MSRQAFKDHRELRVASETARYLTFGNGQNWTTTPASEFFTQKAASDMISNNLSVFKSELGV
ncbi:hypothetical protein GWO43_20035 [candidate division KSB1 bacterium]|nr:hypothetical protein [candidate division KSB1 bacterium]NIX72805.1 hypothetical protein [candidate division KSB1 bacterium]